MYVKILRCCLQLCQLSGVHPEKIGDRSQDFRFFIVMSANISSICLTILLLIQSHNMTLTDITACLESILMIFHGGLKLSNLYIQRHKIRDLLRRLPHFWKIEDLNDEDHKAACFKTIRNLKILTIVYIVVCCGAVFGIAIKPIIFYELVYSNYIPGGVPYPALYVLDGFSYLVGVLISCVVTDFIYMTLVVMITMQFQFLNFGVENMFAADDTQGNEAFRKKIKHWVDYHNYMLDFIRLFNETFSFTVFLYFGVIILSTCMELFIISIELTSGDTIKYYTYMLILFFEFIAFYCIPGQMVMNEAGQLNYNVYASQWREMIQRKKNSTSVKAAMNMILVKTQQKVFISAGILDASFETCLATLKSIASYYMFLKTMSDESR